MATIGLGLQPLGTSPLGTGVVTDDGGGDGGLRDLTITVALAHRSLNAALAGPARLTTTVRTRQLTATVED